jgi:phosphomannomutase
MPQEGPVQGVPAIKGTLSNVEHAFNISRASDSVRVVAVASGSETDRENWERLLTASSRRIFNSDGTTAVFSLLEKVGEKTKEGSMLGTLLAYGAIKEKCRKEGIAYRDHVTLLGMLFGRGERMCPITQARGNRKAAITVSPDAVTAGGILPGYTSIEEALFFFAPTAKYLERRAFRGVLDKWGDETEIASVDLAAAPSLGEDLSRSDVIKFISVIEITEELARQKDWVVFDDEGRMTGLAARNPRSVLLEHLGRKGVRTRPDGKIYAGVSLGPVAFSYDFLDLSLEIFAEDIKKPGVFLDVDPYFLMALTMGPDRASWDREVAADRALSALAGPEGMIPDFFEKIQKIKTVFAKKHGRDLRVKVLDMGPSTYWGDIGQHSSMREKFMALNAASDAGIVARRIAGIPSVRDAKGNIIVNSALDPGVDIRDSVVVNSFISGNGRVAESVILDSEFSDIVSSGAFSVRSVRSGKTSLAAGSGLFESFGSSDLALREGERHVSILTDKRKYDLKVTETADLRDKKGMLDVPVLGNEISFSEAYRLMEGVGIEELERRRCKVMEGLAKYKERSARFKSLAFGTSGLRDKVKNLTDMEVYINTRGFIGFLREKGELTAGASVAVGGDLRPSTARIMSAVVKAILDAGFRANVVGTVPSPVLANYGIVKGVPSIMVTGSHIPADRNGIKFTKTSGEVLKTDEKDILKNVASARETEYARSGEESIFDGKGMFQTPVKLPEDVTRREAEEIYVKRYTDVFAGDALKGRKIVVYQHSAVGRDILADILKKLGADVITVGRSDEFLPVDTEKVSLETIEVLRRSAAEYGPHAVVSMDGDSDRPLVADEKGEFIPGDKLGALVSIYLKPDFAAVPVSANPAVVKALAASGVEVKQTKIGSPFVIAAMNARLAQKPLSKVVSWESNGGFLTGSDWEIGGRKMRALPTRDAVLPIIAVSLLAKIEGLSLSALAESRLPRFYTAAGVVDNKARGAEAYTSDMGKKLVSMFTPRDPAIEEVAYAPGKITVPGREVSREEGKELLFIKAKLERYFGKEEGFGEIVRINFVDGIRMTFRSADGGEEISHIRPSGNAPEFRNYAAADTQERARAIADLRYKIVPEMVKDMLAEKTDLRS